MSQVSRLFFLAVLLVSPTAAAAGGSTDTKACIAAFDVGQKEASDKKLRRARTDLLVCTQEACPSILRADCASVLQKVENAIPSVVFAADDGEGNDLTDIRVTVVGGDTVAQRLDGRSLDFDPGSYEFKFERSKPVNDGSPTAVLVPVSLREGEKNRSVRAMFRRPKPVATETTEPTTPPARRSTVGWVVPGAFAALAVGGFVFAGVERLRFDGRVDDDRRDCAPTCSQAERSDLSSTLVLANVGLGAGIGLVAAAAISWIILAPTKSSRPATTAWAW